MQRPIIAHLQIHSGSFSFSGGDVILYRILDEVPDITVHAHDFVSLIVTGPIWTRGLYINNDEPLVQPQEFIDYIYFQDRAFYKIPIFETASKDELEAHVQQYVDAGWLRDLPQNLLDLRKQEIENYYARYYREREEQGYVVPNRDKATTVEHYRGSLPEAVWNDKKFQSYLSEPEGKVPLPFGYVGSPNRTHESDKNLCDYLGEDLDWSPRMIAEFMASVPARHFADQINHESSSREQIASIFPSFDPSREEWFIEAVSGKKLQKVSP